jgi:phosphatidate cytidylyltransferase
MKELITRSLTGAVYVGLTLGAAFSGPFTTFLLFLPVCAMAAYELHLLYWEKEQAPPSFWSVLVASMSMIVIAMNAFQPSSELGYSIGFIFLLILVSITWMLLSGARNPAQEMGGLLLIIGLVALPFGCIPMLFTFDTWAFVGFMILLWTNDTGAYIVGRLVGRTKLLPSVSPKKTVEGFAGGVMLTLGVAYLLSTWQPFLSMEEWITYGGIIAITSTLGDLLESAFKRARGVKDSGDVLPGHGGILDRFDGFLLAIPAVLLYLTLVS